LGLNHLQLLAVLHSHRRSHSLLRRLSLLLRLHHQLH
jgi:hypothetical protein